MKLLDFERNLTRAMDEAKSSDSEVRAYPPGIENAIAEIQRQPEHPLAEAIRERVERFESTQEDLDLQAQILDRCRNDPSYFISTWVWTYDPRRRPSNMPFLLFPKQEDFITWLQTRVANDEDGLVEKSRDAGLSWLCISYAVWQWLFVPSSKITFGSRKADLVDSLGNPDSLFEKIRILLKNLPEWMRPDDYSDNELRFTNRDNGSTITGEAGDNMGRGGRSTLYFLDEFAFVERAHKVDAAVSENSEVKIYVSTPNGNGNPFAKKRHSGAYPVFNIHWKDDPRKNYWELKDAANNIVSTGRGWDAPPGAKYPWYEGRKAKLDSVVLAQEVDINYSASIEGVCIPAEWVQAAINLRLPPAGRTVAGLDIADEGKNKNVLIVAKGPVVTAIEDWSEGNTTQTAWKARELGNTHGIKHLAYDAIGVGSGVGGTLKSADHLTFTIAGVNGGDSPSETRWSEFDNRTSQEMFRNLRAELWWLLRRRFEKTYEHVNKLAEYPIDELISIPNHPELISQLSQPLRRFNESGKIVIESKEDMKKRGVSSPDYADALCYCFSRNTVKTLGWLGKA